MAKVLIVDDDAVICTLLSDYLSANAFDIQVADSATNAINTIGEFSPNLVLADFQMPDMNGSELLKAIRSSYQELPVILMSGNSDTQSLVESQGLQADGYIQKPFSPKEVLELVKNTVDR